jgi:hypothetical protein
VALHPRVAIVSPEPSLESDEEGLTRQMPVRLNPCLDPLARTRQCLASGAAFDPRHSLSVVFPEPFEAQKGAPARHTRMKSTEAPDAGLLRCDLPCECPQSLREPLVKSFRLAAEPEGAHQVISVSAAQRLASTVGLDHFFTPPVQRFIHLDVG